MHGDPDSPNHRFLTARCWRWSPCLLIIALLASCSSGPSVEDSDGAPDYVPDLNAVREPVPIPEPLSRYGNPASYVVFGKRYYTLTSPRGYVEQGIASWYGTKFHGRRTSSGEPYDMFRMTAAHKTLPLPTYARVTNLDNGRTVVVRVNDRGPFHDDRIIDLSYAAAHKLGIVNNGTGRVEVRAIEPGTSPDHDLQAPALRVSEDVYLQAGAFNSRGNAERLQQQLLQADIAGIQIVSVENAQPALYRVRIGPLANRRDAENLAAVLQTLGVTNPRVVLD